LLRRFVDWRHLQSGIELVDGTEKRKKKADKLLFTVDSRRSYK